MQTYAGFLAGRRMKFREISGRLISRIIQQNMRKLYFYIGACAGVVLIILGIILKVVVVPVVVKDKVADTIALRPGTEAFERWEKLPVPLLFKVTLFEIANPDDVSRGYTPIVRERGPFVYIERRSKVNITVNEEEDLAEYYQKTTYEFSRELSAESDEVSVTVINVPALAYSQIDESLPAFRLALPIYSYFMTKMWPGNPIFVNVRARDFIFDGIPMLCQANEGTYLERILWKALCLAYNYIRPERFVELDVGEPGLNTFSMFKYKNRLDGPYQVKLGLKDPIDIGKIITWKNSTNLGNIWGGESCNAISGTDSTIFRPYLEDVNEVTVFNTDICRSITLKYEGPEEFKGVPVRRYVAGSDVFEYVEDRPENYCYCPRSVKGLTTYGGCLRSGVLDGSSCLGAPSMVSFPHMLMADPFYKKMVLGLNPNKTIHQTFIDLEPNTGYPMRGAARAQINLFLKRIPEVDAMKNFPNSVVPLVWLNEEVELSDDLVDEVKCKLLTILLIVDILCYLLIALGSLTVLCCALFIFGVIKFKRS